MWLISHAITESCPCPVTSSSSLVPRQEVVSTPSDPPRTVSFSYDVVATRITNTDSNGKTKKSKSIKREVAPEGYSHYREGLFFLFVSEARKPTRMMAGIASQNDHVEDQADQDWCVFPALGEPCSSTPLWENVEAPPGPVSKALRFCDEAKLPPARFVAAIWSVILKCYAEVDMAQLWFHDTQIAIDDPSSRAVLMRATLRGTAPFSYLLGNQVWHADKAGRENESNTGLIVTGDSSSSISGCGFLEETPCLLLHAGNPFSHYISTPFCWDCETNPCKTCGILLVLQMGLHRSRLLLCYRKIALSYMHAVMLADTIGNLCLRVIHDPSCTINGLQALDSRSLRLIQRWNSLEPRVEDRPMHEIIHSVAEQYPEILAIDAWDGRMSYAELDATSTRTAAQLRDCGVEEGVLVPVCFEKSMWAVVAMVAVNKAGGAFVPLDPSHPRDRLLKIIKQTNASVVVASPNQEQFLGDPGVKSMVIVPQSVDMSLPPGYISWNPARPDAPAYCLYTSGSTGEPKGCIVEQSAFASIAHHAHSLHISPGSRVIQFASFGFGIHLIEVFCTLASGGTVCMPSEADRRDRLAETIADMDISWALMTPTALSALSPPEVPCLRTVITAGEPIRKSQVSLWTEHVFLYQAYGLTEWAGIYSVSDRITPANSSSGNIGFAVNGRMWIVDTADHTRLCPIGSIGELMIEGPSLAQGYLHDSVATKRAFVALPPSIPQLPGGRVSAAGRRAYRTGDLGRYNSDGSVSHMGRRDTQVKIRGHRVEVGAIEVELRNAVPDWEQVLVELVTPPAGSGANAELVAFTVLGDAAAEAGEPGIFAKADAGFLQRALAAQARLHLVLPAYMIPTAFIPLRTTPRTVSGKADRRLLRLQASYLSWEEWKQYRDLNNVPAIAKADSEQPMKPEPLSTEPERILGQIWAALLNRSIDEIGRHDNFHVLGGDSIVAMRVAAKARAGGLDLSVADIFATPVLSSLAQKVRRKRRDRPGAEEKTSSAFVSLVDEKTRQLCVSDLRSCGGLAPNAGVADILPATETQTFFIARASLDSFCFYLEGEICPDRMREACCAVVRKHSILRTLFTKNSHGLFQVILESWDQLPLQRIIVPDDMEGCCASLRTTGPDESLHLGHLPVRFTLVSSSWSQHALVVTLSHAQHDAYSIPMVFRDLAAAYNGKPSISPSSAQYADYVYYSACRTDAVGYQFWRKYLEGASITQLESHPSQHPFSSYCAESINAAKVHASATIPFLPTPPDGITLSTLVKAGWAFVLSQQARQSDVVFGQTVNGRGSPLEDIDQIVGPCVNFVPFRLTFKDYWTVRDCLEHAQSQHLQTTDHDYLSIGQIVKRSTPWPSDTRFSYIFQHQNVQHQFSLELKSLCNVRSESYLSVYPISEDWIFSIPFENELKLEIVTSECRLGAKFANALVDQLANVVQAFVQGPDQALSSIRPCRL